MKFNFISICTYLCGVSPMYCSLSNYFGPNEFWDHCVLECVIGTLEIHWMLFNNKKMWGLNDNWSQARMINKLISTSSYQWYLGNKYPSNAYFSSIQPLWLHHGMISFSCFYCGSCKILLYHPYCYMSKLRWMHILGSI